MLRGSSSYSAGPGTLVTLCRASFEADEALLVVLAKIAYPCRCSTLEVQPGHLCAEFTTSQLDLQNKRFAQQQQPLCDLFSKLDITTVNEIASWCSSRAERVTQIALGSSMAAEFLKHCRPCQRAALERSGQRRLHWVGRRLRVSPHVNIF